MQLVTEIKDQIRGLTNLANALERKLVGKVKVDRQEPNSSFSESIEDAPASAAPNGREARTWDLDQRILPVSSKSPRNLDESGKASTFPISTFGSADSPDSISSNSRPNAQQLTAPLVAGATAKKVKKRAGKRDRGEGETPSAKAASNMA